METRVLSTQTNVLWKTNQGKRYLHVDFAGLDDYEIIRVTKDLGEIMLNEPDNSIRIITLVKGLNVGFNCHSHIRQLSKNVQPKIFKSAIVGLNSIIMPFFMVYKQFTGTKAELFKTEKQGVQYICS